MMTDEKQKSQTFRSAIIGGMFSGGMTYSILSGGESESGPWPVRVIFTALAAVLVFLVVARIAVHRRSSN